MVSHVIQTGQCFYSFRNSMQACSTYFFFPSKTWFCMSCVSKTTVSWYNGFLKQWHPHGLWLFCSWTLNRYQVLAGVIEQRMLEPLLHQRKLILSAASFAVRTGNTFLGSLLWVFCTLRGLTPLSVLSVHLLTMLLCRWIDYARWVGVQ